MRLPGHKTALTLATLLGITLVTGGCRSEGKGNRKPPAKGQKLVPDARFAGAEPVAVWEIPVEHSLVFGGREISGEETDARRRSRSIWVQRSTLQSKLWLHPQRLVWALPARATPGGNGDRLHLVLKPKANVVALVSHKRKLYWADSPSQVAAWVEGALKPSPALDRLEVLSQHAEGPRSPAAGAGIGRTLYRLTGLLVPRTEAAGARPKPPRFNLRSLATDAKAFGGTGHGQGLLWDLALLPLLTSTSAKSLATLRGPQRWPLQVDLRLARSEPPGAPWLRLTLRLSERKQRHLARRLLRLPPGSGYRRMFGPLTYAMGRQLQRQVVTKPQKRQKGDPRHATLLVKNATQRAAYIYADGVLLGWVGPRQSHTLRTGESGYYRVTARSLFGTTLWGPRDLYIPGEVRLTGK